MWALSDFQDYVKQGDAFVAKREFLKAYREYRLCRRKIDEADTEVLLCIRPNDLEAVFQEATKKQHWVWWQLTEEEKAIANE